MAFSEEKLRMIIARPLALAAVVSACVLLSACGSPGGARDENDYMSAAEKAIGDGDFEEAIVNLKKSIRLDPEKAGPYLKLALIYEKIKLDEEKAKEYYARYLELEKDEALREEVRGWVRRLDSEGGKDTEAVSEGEGRLTRMALELKREEHEAKIRGLKEEHARRLEALQKEIEDARKLTEKGSGQTTQADLLEKKIEELRAELAVVKENDAAHLARISELEAEISKNKAEATRLAREVKSLEKQNQDLKTRLAEATKSGEETTGGSSASTSKTRTDVPGIKAIRGETIYYDVQRGDTLRIIAEKFYGDKGKWSVIFVANRDRLTDENDIKFGQTLKVPVLK